MNKEYLSKHRRKIFLHRCNKNDKEVHDIRYFWSEAAHTNEAKLSEIQNSWGSINRVENLKGVHSMLKLKHPSTCCVVSPSQSGKSSLVRHVINKDAQEHFSAKNKMVLQL
ncbi:hypothetical protein CEXT_148521 [Caerostris extrusa]|uniref:Uncharacterized protein n=1 Tax=Caerostris extrusa TaxID=172846 RepID=A0AAV4UZW9_CAEEX|nr:hypothetical protein CEXT_148521 [Caerostris extrusa]